MTVLIFITEKTYKSIHLPYQQDSCIQWVHAVSDRRDVVLVESATYSVFGFLNEAEKCLKATDLIVVAAHSSRKPEENLMN